MYDDQEFQMPENLRTINNPWFSDRLNVEIFFFILSGFFVYVVNGKIGNVARRLNYSVLDSDPNRIRTQQNSVVDPE